MMTTIAVSPYHGVLCRDRLADRTAARLRFAREALVTGKRLPAGTVGSDRAPGVLGHRQTASGQQIQPRAGQEHRGRVREAAAREPPRRAVVLDEHPVGMARRAGPLYVGSGA